MPIVFVDTNCARNASSFDHLLGNRDVLSKIADIAELYFPSMVIDEIIEQKCSNYEAERAKLSSNKVLVFHNKTLESFALKSFDQIEDSLRCDRSIPFQLIDIEDKLGAFEEACRLSVTRQAPFEVKSDKGFKDFCIAFTIREYVEKHPNQAPVYLMTEDARLTEYFIDLADEVVVIKDLNDFLLQMGMEYRDSEESSETANGETSSVKSVDRDRSRDLNIREAIKKLRESYSFVSTHQAISDLDSLRAFLTSEDKTEILRIAASNDQVTQILGDDDIRSLLMPMFQDLGLKLSADEYRAINERTGWGQVLSYEEKDDLANRELISYREFAAELADHVTRIQVDATVVTDVEKQKDSLERVYRATKLMKEMPTCKPLLDIFIKGEYAYEDKGFAVEPLKGFIELLRSCSHVQLETVSLNLGMLLRSVDRCQDISAYYGDVIPF